MFTGEFRFTFYRSNINFHEVQTELHRVLQICTKKWYPTYAIQYSITCSVCTDDVTPNSSHSRKQSIIQHQSRVALAAVGIAVPYFSDKLY
jgi:hypothetical protein